MLTSSCNRNRGRMIFGHCWRLLSRRVVMTPYRSRRTTADKALTPLRILTTQYNMEQVVDKKKCGKMIRVYLMYKIINPYFSDTHSVTKDLT